MTGGKPSSTVFKRCVIGLCSWRSVGKLQKNLIVFVAMERTTEFGGHFIANSKRPMIPRSLIVQMQSIQSRDVASVFILGKD